jgi:hypothetical protein
MIVRVELISQAHERVAIVAIPGAPEAPSVVLWCGRAFHRFAGGGRKLSHGDIYRECSAVTAIEENPQNESDCNA